MQCNICLWTSLVCQVTAHCEWFGDGGRRNVPKLIATSLPGGQKVMGQVKSSASKRYDLSFPASWGFSQWKLQFSWCCEGMWGPCILIMFETVAHNTDSFGPALTTCFFFYRWSPLLAAEALRTWGRKPQPTANTLPAVPRPKRRPESAAFHEPKDFFCYGKLMA